jgi:hypothetical protein
LTQERLEIFLDNLPTTGSMPSQKNISFGTVPIYISIFQQHHQSTEVVLHQFRRTLLLRTIMDAGVARYFLLVFSRCLADFCITRSYLSSGTFLIKRKSGLPLSSHKLGLSFITKTQLSYVRTHYQFLETAPSHSLNTFARNTCLAQEKILNRLTIVEKRFINLIGNMSIVTSHNGYTFSSTSCIPY